MRWWPWNLHQLKQFNCVFTRKLCRRISSDSWKKSCNKRKLRLKQKINLSLKKSWVDFPQQKFSTAWKKQLDHQIPSVLSPSLSWFPRCLKREGPWLSCWPHPWFGMRQHPASKWHQIAKWSFLKAPIFFYKKDGGKGCSSCYGIPINGRKSLCNWGYNL